MSETNTLELSVAAKSDTGLKRDENQDRMSRFFSPFGEVFLVADGMGGHRGGAKAAAMVGDGLNRHLRSLPPDTPVELAIRMAAEKTNTEVVRESRAGHEETAGMGATLVLAILRGNDAVIAHVGDSRAYLYRDGDLRNLTRDHTRGRDKVDAGLLTEEEAFDHPDSSVLTRAFGHSDPLAVDISAPLQLHAGDQILLCTDGLCGYVRDKTIAEVLARGLDPKHTAEKLVQLANEAGGEDNVTVQVIRAASEDFHEREPATTVLEGSKTGIHPGAPSARWRQFVQRKKLIIILSVAALLLIAAFGAVVKLGWVSLKRGAAHPLDSAQAATHQLQPPAASGEHPQTNTQPAPGRNQQAVTPQTPGARPPVKPVVLLIGENKFVKGLDKQGQVTLILATTEKNIFASIPTDENAVLWPNDENEAILDLAKKIHEGLQHESPNPVTFRRVEQLEKRRLPVKSRTAIVVIVSNSPHAKPDAAATTKK